MGDHGEVIEHGEEAVHGGEDVDHGDGGGHDAHGAIHTGEIVVLFIMLSTLLGVWTRHTKQYVKHPFPYTVVLLIVGGLINGIAIAIGYDKLGILGEILESVASIDPHLLLLAFIPTLIFESAFSVNFHIMYREFWQALLLAGPGVIINSLLTAVFMMYVVQYDWNFPTAWLFGTIASATDPVAVVALLRELGASKRLATLIEGESLMNDGSAFVLFMILLPFAEDNNQKTPGEIAGMAFQLSLVGPVIGVAVGLFCVGWIERVWNDALVETSITILAAYLTFYLAEVHLHTSGVLALVFLGLTFSKYKSVISPKTEHALHHVWEMMSYVANTLIFVLSGIIVVDQIFGPGHDIEGKDFGWAIVIYIGVHITRAITLAILYLPLQQMGYGFSWQEAVILWIGALRGAIGLALGLITFGSQLLPQKTKDRIMFHIAAIVALILLIDGIVIKYVLASLNIDTGGPHTEHIVIQAMSHLKKESHNLIEHIRHDRHYAGANWEIIKQGLPDYEEIHPATATDASYDRVNDLLPDQKDKQASDSLDEMRCRFLSAMKAFYWQQFEEGQTNKEAVDILNEAAESALDDHDLETQWDLMAGHFEIPALLKWIHQFKCLAPCSTRILYRRLAMAVELIIAYVSASERMGNVMDSFPEFQGMKDVDILNNERSEFEQKAYRKLNEIRTTYPEIYAAIQTKHAAKYVLHHDAKNIIKLMHDGIIDEAERDSLEHLVDYHLLKLTVAPKEPQSPTDILKNLGFIKLLPEHEKDFVVEHVSKGLYSKDDFLFKEEIPDCIFLITVGQVSVKVLNEAREVTLGVGTVIGTWEFLSGKRIYEYVQAQTPVVEAWMLHQREIKHITREREANAMLWKMTASTLCKAKFARFFQLDSRGISKACMSGTLGAFDDDSFGIELDKMTLLLCGSARCRGLQDKEEVAVQAPAMMRFFEKTIVKFSAGSRFLVFETLGGAGAGAGNANVAGQEIQDRKSTIMRSHSDTNFANVDSLMPSRVPDIYRRASSNNASWDRQPSVISNFLLPGTSEPQRRHSAASIELFELYTPEEEEKHALPQKQNGTIPTHDDVVGDIVESEVGSAGGAGSTGDKSPKVDYKGASGSGEIRVNVESADSGSI